MDEIKWAEVKNNNPQTAYLYGVKTTMIFCLPSCKSKLPLRKNVVFLESIEQALELGFRPCKRCRPDLNGAYDPKGQMLKGIKDFIDAGTDNPKCLAELAGRFNLSSFHLSRIFQAKYGLTPKEYLRQRQVNLALELLKTTELITVEVAFNCGFPPTQPFIPPSRLLRENRR